VALKTAAMSRTEDAITSAKTMGVTTKARGNLNAATDLSEPTTNGRPPAKAAAAKAAKAAPVAVVADPISTQTSRPTSIPTSSPTTSCSKWISSMSK
jgi:hypothetical protein